MSENSLNHAILYKCRKMLCMKIDIWLIKLAESRGKQSYDIVCMIEIW